MDKTSILIMRFSLAYLLLITVWGNFSNSQILTLSTDYSLFVFMAVYLIGAVFLLMGHRTCLASTVLGVCSVFYAYTYYADIAWFLALALFLLSGQLLIANVNGCRDRLQLSYHALRCKLSQYGLANTANCHIDK